MSAAPMQVEVRRIDSKEPVQGATVEIRERRNLSMFDSYQDESATTDDRGAAVILGPLKRPFDTIVTVPGAPAEKWVFGHPAQTSDYQVWSAGDPIGVNKPPAFEARVLKAPRHSDK